METDPKSKGKQSKKLESQKRRGNYLRLLNHITELQDNSDVSINSVNELNDIFKEVTVIDGQCPIEERVGCINETLLELTVILSASSVVVNQLENLNIFTSTYEPLDFSEKLLNLVKSDNVDDDSSHNWLNLLEDARKLIPQLPNYSFLYGTYDPSKIPKPRQQKGHKREAQARVEKKTLGNVYTLEKGEEGIEETVNLLMKVLRDEYERSNYTPLNYYDFVIDSESFTSTVENIFYTSFLIKDGKAELNLQNINKPTIKPMHKRDLKAFRDHDGVNTQLITSFTMADWEKLKVPGFIQKHRALIKLNS